MYAIMYVCMDGWMYACMYIPRIHAHVCYISIDKHSYARDSTYTHILKCCLFAVGSCGAYSFMVSPYVIPIYMHALSENVQLDFCVGVLSRVLCDLFDFVVSLFNVCLVVDHVVFSLLGTHVKAYATASPCVFLFIFASKYVVFYLCRVFYISAALSSFGEAPCQSSGQWEAHAELGSRKSIANWNVAIGEHIAGAGICTALRPVNWSQR